MKIKRVKITALIEHKLGADEELEVLNYLAGPKDHITLSSSQGVTELEVVGEARQFEPSGPFVYTVKIEKNK